MSNTPVQDNIRAYALEQVGAAYIMGATAIKCTPKYRKARAAQYPDYADKIIDNCPVLSGKQSSCEGCKYEGELSFDCAQLSKFAAAAGGVQLPSGSNSQWTKVDWFQKGEIASMPMDVVCFVFHHNEQTGRKSHVGVYLGDGTVSDARGHANGVLHKDVASYPWTHYAIPYEVAKEVVEAGRRPASDSDCSQSPSEALDWREQLRAEWDMSERPTYAEMRRDTIRKGSRGNAVAELQGILNSWDPDLQLAVDGKFGAATHAAVIRFQQAHGLTDDGVVGPNTWTVLLKLAVEPDDGEQEADDTAPKECPDLAMMMAVIDVAMDELKASLKEIVTALVGGDSIG